MSEFAYKAGLHSVGSYQASGIPYATSSVIAAALGNAPTRVQFPNVTKFVTIKNTDSSLYVRAGFSSIGVSGTVAGNSNFFLLSPAESYTADLRITDLFLLGDTTASCTVSIIAGLTGIRASELVNNWSGSIGVG